MSSEALKKGWTGGESEMPRALNRSFCSLTDTVEFGEVVLQPPELTVQPRRSIGRDAVRGDQVMQGVGSVRSFLCLLAGKCPGLLAAGSGDRLGHSCICWGQMSWTLSC